MSEVLDPLDEEPYDPLDEAAYEPSVQDIAGGSDPEDGFYASLVEQRQRSAELVSVPDVKKPKKYFAVTERRKRKFLQALAKTGNVSMASAAAGWAPNAARSAKKFDPLFAENWAEALEIAADFVEAEMFRRAVHGVQEEVYKLDKEGNPVLVNTVTRYSDQLMAILVKGLKPEKYRERQEIKHEGTKGGVLLLPAAVPLDEWEAAAAAQQAQYRETQESVE